MRVQWRKIKDPSLWIFGLVSAIHKDSAHRSYAINFGRRSLYIQIHYADDEEEN